MNIKIGLPLVEKLSVYLENESVVIQSLEGPVVGHINSHRDGQRKRR